MNKRVIGSEYEKIAGNYLKMHGIKILEYNYRIRQGEIDIIGLDEQCLVFFEVKYRKNNHLGNPLEAVTIKKQQQISKVALFYINSHSYLLNKEIRFDVIGILDQDVTWVKDAFYFSY